MNERINGQILLKWLPAIVVITTWTIAGLAGFFTLKSEVAQIRIESKSEAIQVKERLLDYQATQLESMRELNKRLDRIESLLWEHTRK